MIKTLICLLFFFCDFYLCLGSRQNNYRIIHDKIIIESYNHSAVRNPSVTVRDFNSTSKLGVFRADGDILIEVKKNILVTISISKLVGTVYRSIPLPIDTSFDLCSDIFQKSKEFQVVLSHSNLHGCPSPPGKYYLTEYLLEEEKFPPHIPIGKYKLFLEAYLDDTIFLGNGTWFGGIVRRK